ncbi:MAG: hypothetical protein AAGF88_02150 [Pseudomonadota bacterium]
MARKKSTSSKTEKDTLDTAGNVASDDENADATATETTEADASETSDAETAETSEAAALSADGDADTEADAEAGMSAEGDAAAEEATTDPVPEAPSPETIEDQAPVAATPSTMEHPERAGSGPGFFPLALGGIVAGAIGFGAGYFYDLGGTGQVDELAGSVETQSASIDTLADQIAALEADLAGFAPPEVDLSAIETALADLSGQSEITSAELADLASRIEAVEARPVFTGEAGTDEAALAAAIEQLRAELSDQQSANETLAAEIEAMAADAETRIAEAEARAGASAEDAAMQAGLSELRIALASGTPFADALSEIADSEGFDIPEPLAAVAETGVPTLAELEAEFPAAARAALPAALQANAGDTAGERLGAFLRSQVGGRALEPQEGDDPDAILSRAGAAVETGDLNGALAELTALPDPALEVMAAWIESTATRVSALEAIDGLAGTLEGN